MRKLIRYRVSLSSLASVLPRRSTKFHLCDDLARGLRIGEKWAWGQSRNGTCRHKTSRVIV